MRTVTIYSIVALALSCLVFPGPSLAGAAPGASPVAKVEEKSAGFDFQKLSQEAADRVRAKALFNADTVPQLQRAVDRFSNQHSYRGYPADQLAEMLWQLRVAPETQKRLLGTILAAGNGEELRKALNETERYLESTRRIARSLTLGQDYQSRRIVSKISEAEYRLRLAAENLEMEKRHEVAMAEAAAINDMLRSAKLRFYDVEPYLEPLAKLKDNPEALRAAASIIKKRGMSRERVRTLLDKLATSPKEGMDDIANIDAINAVNDAFRYALQVEGEDDVITLPLAAIIPGAAEQLAKNKSIPLAASTFKRTDKLLQTRRLEKLLLVEGEHGLPLRSEKAGENEHIAFLNPGERLYILRSGVGEAILRGTPLDAVADSGPRLAEYGEKTRYAFDAYFEHSPASGLRSVYLIAAACGPEELRAHLASLMVMRSEREKSLYGPFEDFVWKKEDAPYTSRVIADLPPDTPGAALRLADVRDADIFLALAPLADKEGLERLMGPIRGIWAKNRPMDKTPWAQLRYTPGGKTVSSTLGASPVLELDKTALESIIAAKRSFLEYAWATYLVRERTEADANGKKEADYAALLPEALQTMTARFDAMAKKGFVSPWDMGRAVYYLERAGNDAAMAGTLQAIADDESLSSAKRLRAMRSALKNK